jgi:glucose/arabinose dehydrogenase
MQNSWIYITYSSTGGEGEGGNTKLILKLLDGALTQIESLYKAGPNTTKGQHFGSRIVFDKEGFLYFSRRKRKPF